MLFIAGLACACGQGPSSSAGSSEEPEAFLQRRVEAEQRGWPESFGFGRAARAREIDSLDIDVRPDGEGLPPGSGTAYSGSVVYATKCASCHGKTGAEGPFAKLVTTDDGREKTIGNYWPYATTIYDYINRSMPYNAPGSLTPEEVYSLTAYLLHANKIIGPDTIINAETLPAIVMPAQKLFIPDDRKGGPEVR